ncbi:MAG: hypothetical protein ACYCW6_24215 [Candidatus Xenobia bacterium]
MAHRTTLLLDNESQQAARELALRFKCSTSEAIRRALLGYRDVVCGVTPETRKARTAILHRIFELSEGSDPAEEVRHLKAQDEHF